MKLFGKGFFGPLITLFFSYFVYLNSAYSHFGGRSYSTWKLKDHSVEASLRIKAFLIRKIPSLDPKEFNLTKRLNSHIEEKILVTKEDEHCPFLKKPMALPLQGGDMVVSFSFRCPKRLLDLSKVKIYFHAFFPFSPTHLHFAEIDYLGKREKKYILFSKDKRVYSLQ